MTKQELKLQEVKRYFENQDFLLGFRKLLDCVADTQNMNIYEKAIHLVEIKESTSSFTSDFIEKCLELINQIQKHSVKETSRNNYVLKASEISKTYGKNNFSLKPISIQIHKGQVYGLVGENGNGKTTLLRILAKEITQSSGLLEYNFEKPYVDEYDLKTRLVYIPQRTEKWYGSLMDNLKFVLANYNYNPNEINLRVLLMISRLGLWNYKDLKWSELSSGYKMRFELARTLLRKPEILLLDEPLANLDVLAQQIILEDLKDIADSIVNPIALILSSQQLFEVEKISDKVVFLKNGQYHEVNFKNDIEQTKELIVEIDTDVEREVLINVFKDLQTTKITYNGGIYLIYFNGDITFSQVISTLGNSKIKVTYVRDISTSTRRFFIN